MNPLTVFVSIPSGVSAGNILRGGLVDRLLEARRDVAVVIVSPLVKDESFVREFTRARVTFEDLPSHMPAGLEGRLMALVQAGYLDSGVTESDPRIRCGHGQVRSGGHVVAVENSASH